MGRHSARQRRIFIWVFVFFISLMAWTQAGCATIGVSPASAPGPNQPESPTSADGGSSRFGSKKVVGIVTVAFLGGFLLYRLFKGNDAQDTADPNPGSSNPGHGGTLLFSPLPSATPFPFERPHLDPWLNPTGMPLSGIDSKAWSRGWSWGSWPVSGRMSVVPVPGVRPRPRVGAQDRRPPRPQ